MLFVVMIGHADCLKETMLFDTFTVPRCPTCRKTSCSNEAMHMVWGNIRYSIALQPMRVEMGTIQVGDQLSTRYGPFVVDSMEKIMTTEGVSDTRLTTQFLVFPPHGPSPLLSPSSLLPQPTPLLSQPQPFPSQPPPLRSFSLENPHNYLYRGRLIRWQLGPRSGQTAPAQAQVLI